MTPIATYRPLIGLLRESTPRQVVSLVVLMVLAGLTEGVGVLLLVPLLALLQGGSASGNALVQAMLDIATVTGGAPSVGGLLAVFVLLVALRAGIGYLREVRGAALQYGVVDRLRERSFAALLGAEWRWLAARRRSDDAHLLLADINRVGVGLNFGLQLCATLVTVAAYVLAALALSWRMTLVALASGGVILWALAGQRRAAVALGHGLGAAGRAMQANVQESLAGLKLARIHGNEQRHLGHFREVMARLRLEQLRFMAGTSRFKALFQAVGAALLAVYLYAGLQWLGTPAPELLTLVLVFGRLIPLFSAAHQQHHQWLHALPALQATEQLLVDCRAAAEPAADTPAAPWTVRESIRLEQVTLRYAGRDVPALCDVSLNLPAGSTTAITGPSGAGKSTLADVLMGLVAPDAGTLRVDGVAVDAAQRPRWRRHVAYVPQEIFLFHDSIRANLLWAAPEATDTELKTALRRAAADFVFALPAGMDTVVGDAGVLLAGGERQRLALARALLARPSLLILDEATSALDPGNEARVRAAIEGLHGDLTVVVIGHRLPGLEKADQVIRLDGGRVAT